MYYGQLTTQELIKVALHWTKDLHRDIMGGKHYPTSYLKGELQELGEAVKNRDWKNFKEELGDCSHAGTMLAAQKTGLNLPVIGADPEIKKFYDRIEVWKGMFKDKGVPFHVDHLGGGSNFAKPEKIEKAFASAGHTLKPGEAKQMALDARTFYSCIRN